MLFLRSTCLGTDADWSDLSAFDLRQVVIHECFTTDVDVGELLEHFHRLETLVLSEEAISDPVTLMRMIPASIRHVHLLQQTFYIVEDQPDNPRALPHLESFTFTWIAARAPAKEASDSLPQLQRVIKSNIIAPQCTFKYIRSTNSPESLVMDALAGFNV